MWLLLAVAATALVVLLIVNLTAPEKKIERPIEHTYLVGDPQFIRAVNSLLGPPLTDGNRVTALQNGDQIFPAMLEAIHSARRTITFETYIYWSGTVGKEFTDALVERSRAGVRVHLILDWVGAGKLDGAMIDEMKAAGVEVERYHPLKWYNLGRMNNRTHRKLLVVDGRIGFTGGVGIADIWSGNGQDPEHWRDSHFKLEGPAVAEMQAAFMDNWIETRSVVLHDEAYFPPLEPVGSAPDQEAAAPGDSVESTLAQVFTSSAGNASESIRLMYLLSIAAAGESIRIGNAYFVPDELAVQTLVAAARRGVKVEIIVPGRHTDSDVVRNASRSLWGPLLEVGVEIYEYTPTMYHTKIMIVDRIWTSVGSTNFDNRSFRLNDEANLNILDRAFAEGQIAVFEADKARATRVTLEGWRNRPRMERLKEWLAGTLRFQL